MFKNLEIDMLDMFRLDLSRLFYLCKFSFVVHAKCSLYELLS